MAGELRELLQLGVGLGQQLQRLAELLGGLVEVGVEGQPDVEQHELEEGERPFDVWLQAAVAGFGEPP